MSDENKSEEEQPRRLYRSSDEEVIAGVAAGIADYFDLDPALVRIVFVLLALINGWGLVLYIILAIILPERSTKKQTDQPVKAKEHRQEKNEQRKTLIGISIVLIGVIALFNQFVPFSWWRTDVFWPSLLIIIGIYLLVKDRGQK